MCMGIATRQPVPTQDPLDDFDSEVRIVYTDPIPLPAAWPTAPPPTHALDTTSRVISFVLGFALASLIAWLGSISGDEVAATGNSDPVASVGTPVAPVATQEKRPSIITEQRATAPPTVAAATSSAPPAAAPRTIAAASAPAAAPKKTAEPAPPVVSAPASRASRPAASGYRGALALSSSPEGAQVVVNGKVVGQTPVVLNDLPVGSRAVIVRRDGYSPWSTSVRVVAGQRTTVRATLKPTPQTGG